MQLVHNEKTQEQWSVCVDKYIVWSGVQHSQFLRVRVSDALDVHLQNELKPRPQQLQYGLPVPERKKSTNDTTTLRCGAGTVTETKTQRINFYKSGYFSCTSSGVLG